MAARGTTRLLSSLRELSVSGRLMSTAGARSATRIGKYAAGLVLVGAGLWTVDQQSEILKSSVQSSLLACADAAAVPSYPSQSAPGGFRTDTSTDMQFPVELALTTPTPLLNLVGLGVRTVSFLRVKVYSAGFYVESADLKQLHKVPGWHMFTAQHLLVPPTRSDDPLHAPQLSGEALMKELIDRPVACAVRIVPVRNTDFGHLRDAFTRAIATRQKLARASGKLTDSDEERIAQSTQALKSLFPAQSVPKGKALTLLRTGTGSLVVEYEGKVLGQVNDPWVSRELMLAYFADKDVISAQLKEDVAKGFEAVMKR